MNTTNERSIIVTGGSGFIGSNVCKTLVASGFNVINIDKRKRDIDGVTQYPFEVDNKQVLGILKLLQPDAVIHIAADNSVPFSIKNPNQTYTQNVQQTISLLNNCLDANIKNFIFASSSSVYGHSVNADGSFVEGDPLAPVNPYGRSKQMCEAIIQDYASAFDISYANLRLFNVAGSANGKFGYQKDPLVHVLPIIAQKALQDEEFEIFGNDYPTPDGTAVRDYTHVADVSRAFLSAEYYLLDGNKSVTLNIGNNNPVSIDQLVSMVESASSTTIKRVYKPQRPGDMVSTHANIQNASRTLGWEPSFSTQDIIVDELKWQKTKLKRK